jgi:YfiH family protein
MAPPPATYRLHEHAETATYLTLPTFDALAGGAARLVIGTRRGGVSEGRYTSLNLGLSTDDRAERVRENRARLCRAAGVRLGATVGMNQVHGARVAVVGAEDRGRGALDGATALAKTDALVTASTGVALRALAADCVPIALYDRRSGALGAVHAGWRGILAGVLPAAVAALLQVAGSEPRHLVAALGPCIGPCHYEVGPEVSEPFRRAFSRQQGLDGTGEDEVVHERGGRTYLDLQAALCAQLRASGVPAEQVVMVDLCTACRTDLLYSHRAEGPTGRFGLLVWREG